MTDDIDDVVDDENDDEDVDNEDVDNEDDDGLETFAGSPSLFDTNKKSNDDDDDGEQAVVSIPMTGRLWIQVESWNNNNDLQEEEDEDAGGISNWKRSFAKVLVMAKRLNAVLVEPGIRDGGLTTCHNGNLQLTEVYNRTILLLQTTTTSSSSSSSTYSDHHDDFHPYLLASCSQYTTFMNQLTVPQTFDLCLNKDKFMGCNNLQGKELESEYQQKTSQSLEQALAEIIQSSSPNSGRSSNKNSAAVVILRLHNVGTSSLDKFTIPTMLISPPKTNNAPANDHRQPPPPPPPPAPERIPLIDKEEVAEFESEHYQFLDAHYDYLDAQLQAAGIPPASYGVIHWRPLSPSAAAAKANKNPHHHGDHGDGDHGNGDHDLSIMDYYNKCVHQIVQTKKAMNLPPTTPFLLISSISSSLEDDDDDDDDDHVQDDSTTTKKNAAQTALSTLLTKHHFLQLEDIILPSSSSLKDSVMYAVMDLILAENAFSFATCSEDLCSSNNKNNNGGRPSFASCQECNNVRGGFSKHAMELREVGNHNNNANTYPCWPQSSSELHEIHNLWQQP